MVSVIIPARNETYLQKTIENVLANAEGEIEVIAICDGYWPEPSIKDDPRVVLIHHTEPRGQRQSINQAARIAKGRYIMKLDAHCAVDKGFDVKLAADCEYDWTVVPRMYNLDVDTWRPKDIDDFRTALRRGKVHDYMFLGMNEKNQFRTQYYPHAENTRIHLENADKLIDDTMSCMGPCFFMHKERFWELGGCDENHGSWGQQGIEVALKAWLSGGALKVNKKTWFAHWFRADVGFPYQISGKDQERARQYSMDLWFNGKWEKQVRPLQWVFDKFNPPVPAAVPVPPVVPDARRIRVNNYLYAHIHKRRHYASWRGVNILKMPSDLLLYQRVIWEHKPDYIVEIGTKWGGSALFLQDCLDLTGKGKVITVDINPQVENPDPRIAYLVGSSIAPEIVAQIKGLTKDGSVMVILDGDHRRTHVKWELKHYAPIVSPGQYLVIEDCYAGSGKLYGPGEARDWFLARTNDFEQTNLCDEFLVGICLGGWLRRK